MIEEKNSLIEAAEFTLNRAKKIVEENAELFEECKKYHDLWKEEKEGRTAHLHISDNYVGVNLQFYLTEDDSMHDFNLFLDEIPYEIEKIDDAVDYKWIRYRMAVPKGALYIFCHYDRSEHCKLVETGETKPVYKRVCV